MMSSRRTSGTHWRVLILVGLSVGLMIALALVFLPGGRGPGHANSAEARTPAMVLDAGAHAALAAPDVVPAASQFYYVKIDDYQAWLSIDGTHDGKVISNGEATPLPGCRNGRQTVVGTSATGTQACVARGAYLANAPTTATAMKTFLVGSVASSGTGAANALGKQIASVLQFNYLRPAARAALLEVAKSLPGLTVDPAGTSGVGAGEVAISWPAPDGGGSTQLIFDQSTNAYIGLRTIGASGQVGTASAPSVAIVNAVGDTQ